MVRIGPGHVVSSFGGDAPRDPKIINFGPLKDEYLENGNNNNITIYKAHNVRKKLNLRRRQSLGGGKSNSV